MLPQWIIEKKRDAQPLAEEEIRFFIEGYVRGDIPDYQMSALAMAIFFRGMSSAEVAILTDAMMHSGSILDMSAVGAPTADKHSTGGIGDKVSIPLAPLVACGGVAVPMISGRGLGITGGTLDKFESIPGYRTDLNEKEFFNVIKKCGCSVIGQTKTLAPADKKLYALRDVTATVPSIPLIVASIMCKKLAEGIDALVLDVKVGSGAFMKSIDQARELARRMVEVGAKMNKRVKAIITDMNQPLGRCAGNALEIKESLEVLEGKGPADLVDITLELSAEMLVLTGQVKTRNEGKKILQQKLASGEAYERFIEMVKLHGGDTKSLMQGGAGLPQAKLKEAVLSLQDGYVTQADAEKIGRACILLGAGRARVEDKIDPAVGVSGLVKCGEAVKKGEALLTIHANDAARLKEARKLIDQAFIISSSPGQSAPLFIEEI